MCGRPGRSPGDTWRQATLALSGGRGAPRALKRPTNDVSPIAVRSSFDSAIGDQRAHICVEPPAQDPLQDGPVVVASEARHALFRRSLYRRHPPTDRRPSMGLGDTERRSSQRGLPGISGADDTPSSSARRGVAQRQLLVLARAVLAPMVEAPMLVSQRGCSSRSHQPSPLLIDFRRTQ